MPSFRNLMANAPVGFAFFDTDLRYVVVNHKLAELDGKPVGIHMGRRVEEMAPRMAERAREALREVMETRKPVLDQEYISEMVPDASRYWSANWYPVQYPDGYLLGISCVVIDISGYKLALDALRLNQQRLELAQAVAGIGSWDWDLETNEIHCSAEYGPLYGLPRSDRAPAPEDWLNTVHPEDRGRVREEMRHSLAGVDDYSSEFRVVWPDGSIHWLFAKGRVFRDPAGKVTRVLGVNLDITGRKQAEQALRESEERFRSMADTAPVMICVLGPDKLATFFNKGWLNFTGHRMDQELGYGWVCGIHPEDRERTVAAISVSAEARHYSQTEYRLRRADGEYRWMLCNGVPRFDPDGTFAGYVASCVDVTDFKRAQEEALARQKLESLGVLAGGIAHDFNNLLGSIVADAELLKSELGGDSGAIQGIQRIELVAHRASEIVRELMVYAGHESPAPDWVDLSTLVREMVELLKISISKRAALKLDLPTNLPAVVANAALVRQVVLNLIVNASEALCEKEGVITVKVSPIQLGPDLMGGSASNLAPGDYIRLEVGDTGCGIAEDIQARIFEPFFTTKSAGRGLGLASVQGIVRSHRGAVQVVSAPGRGSRFELLLPCAGRPATLPVVAAPVPQAVEGSATVLMVEDEDTLRQPVAKILRKRGFAVLEAGDGRTAVTLFQERGPDIDVVLLDMTLPSLSGSEVMEELRRLRPDVKVVLTSAYGQETVIRAVGGQQPWAYVRKPYSPREVGDLLWKACAALPDR